MAIETVRVSTKARDQLVTLKRRTGIQHWNVLCRWALCVSLAEPTPPRDEKITTDSSVEMTWKTFGGPYHELYSALISMRCQKDGLPVDPPTVAHQFRLHLHRGIAYLAGDPSIRSIESLVASAPSFAGT